jgi:ketosteroid isomerase-like protein
MKKIIFLFLGVCMNLISQTKENSLVWSIEKADEWANNQKWFVGCNFIPSTAINQLEMWQKETFDIATIDKELGWAEKIGFNAIRVYLHNIVWEEDKDAFKERINTFLNFTDKHKIKVIFVLFDDCWLKDPKPGKQPEPIPGVHNSGWLQCPGEIILNDPSKWEPLKNYTKDIIYSFAQDERIAFWDLYNEPGNSGYGNKTLPLLKKVFEWAREVNPSQPITSALWIDRTDETTDFLINNSDIITFHKYQNETEMEKIVKSLLGFHRPIICSEYMARTNNSMFENIMPLLARYNVGAINWGFVSGKTNTIFPWGSKEGTPEPEIWFHDIFRKDGTPFDKNEPDLILSISKTMKNCRNIHNMVQNEVINTERSFSKMCVETSIKESFLQYMHDDAIGFQAGPVKMKEIYSKREKSATYLYWEPEYVEVSAAGDLALSTGPWELRKTKADSANASFGHFITIWQKQPDNTWKFIFDAGISHDKTEVKPVNVKTFIPQKHEPDYPLEIDLKKEHDAIMELEKKFADGLDKEDFEKNYSPIVSDDVKLYREGWYPSKDKTETLDKIKKMEGKISWKTIKSTVAASGDFAYTYGLMEITGKAGIEKFNYMHVWRKIPNDSWKIILDSATPYPKQK